MTKASSKFLVFILLAATFLLIPTKEASAISFWTRYRININIADKHGADYEVGERATFNVRIRKRVLRFSKKGWWFYYTYIYTDIPEANLRVTFPNNSSEVTLTRTGTGRYEYQTPVLEELGTKRLKVRIGFRYWGSYFFTLRSRSYTIYVRGPPTIEITDPSDGSILGADTISVSGTVNDNSAEVEVNETPADVSDYRFSAEISLEEGENEITARATNPFGEDSDSITVTLDTTPPQNPSLSIEEGNQTDARLIHLLLYAEEADEVIISEDQTFAGSIWEPYVETREYTLSAGEGLKRIYVKYRDEIGNETEVLQGRIVLGHVISITSPSEGITINASWITVTGTINSEDIPVYINGLSAEIAASTFYINYLPLAVGDNTITAQAYFEGELLEEAVVSVLTEELTDPVQITANPLSGEPDLEVDFTVTTNLENPITNYAWDFDNDGLVDRESPTTGDTNHTYDEVRLYHPTVRITDTNLTQFTATVTINVHLLRQLDWAIDIEDPIDLAVDAERNLYILQQTTAQIQKYDKDGTYIDTFGGVGQAPGQFTNPCGIALDQDGNIYVADTDNNRIQKLDPFGLPDDTFGEEGIVGINVDTDEDDILDPGTEPSQFNQPYGIAVDGEGNVYVTDTGNNRIQKFSPAGEFQLQWGEPGDEERQLNQPQGIAVDALGDIYIADTGNNRIQIFTSMGSYQGAFGIGGTDEGELNTPTDIAILGYSIYIADEGNDRIQKFEERNLNISYIFKVETFLIDEEVNILSHPVSVTPDRNLQRELIYVADSGNNRVVKIELPVILPVETWDAMKEAILAGDVESALSNFSADAKDRYRAAFALWGDDLIDLVSEMADIESVSIEEERAVYWLQREEYGRVFTYDVYFEKDENGEWKIRAF